MDNLKAEMQRNGLTVKDIMSTIDVQRKLPETKSMEKLILHTRKLKKFGTCFSRG